MKLFLLLSLFVFLACRERQDKAVAKDPATDTTTPVNNDPVFQNQTAVLEEFFADSLSIGRKTFNKIEVSKFKSADSNYVLIKFYSRQNNAWLLKDEFQFLKDAMLPCDTKLSDFNNDGLNDMTYVSEFSPRSGNETRKLFIYDSIHDKLIYIKNSDEFPNLLYNKELNCIDAFFVFAGCSTVFLKIKGDSLKRFATVDLFHDLTVTVFDKNGNEKVIQEGPTDKIGYIRFKNYKPLKEYEQQ